MPGRDEAADAVAGLGNPDGWADPYPFYARLRRSAPVYRDSSLGMYLVSRYDDCQTVLTSSSMRTPDHEWHDRIQPGWRDHPAAVWCFTSLPFEERVNHTRIRTLVNKAFTRRRVESLRPSIQRVVDGLLDGLREQGGDGAVVDLQDAVGFRLPVAVIAALVGVPDTDLPRFRWAFGDILRVMDLVVDDATLAQADTAMLDVRDYFTHLLRERRDDPTEDLASALLAVRDDDGDRLSEEELLSLVILLFTAGFETTTLTIGTGTQALLTRPEQRELLRADPSLAAGAVEEVLRWDCSLQRVVRMAAEDVELGGVEIPAGSVVAPLLGAGNRDPQAFDDPDRFDVRRRGARPLTFGGGPYGCLGNQLARVELELYLAALTQRFPELEPAGDPVRRPGIYVRGLDVLPVTVGSRTLARA